MVAPEGGGDVFELLLGFWLRLCAGNWVQLGVLWVRVKVRVSVRVRVRLRASVERISLGRLGRRR